MLGKRHQAFTLAEMMIVMLILTILLAAFAPLVTKRKNVDLSNPWRWAANNSDIYYGIGKNQTALIGIKSKNANDPKARVVIQTSDATDSHILFKGSNQVLAQLLIPYGKRSIYLGGTGYDGDTYNSVASADGSQNVSIGYYALKFPQLAHRVIAIGEGAMSTMDNTRTMERVTAIGYHSMQQYPNSVNTAVGALSLAGTNKTVEDYEADTDHDAPGEQNTAIGVSSMQYNKKGQYNTAVGHGSLANGTNGNHSTAIGAYSLFYFTNKERSATDTESLSLSYAANTAVGSQALYGIQGQNNTGYNNTAVGTEAGRRISSGYNNTALGFASLGAGAAEGQLPVTGYDNTAVGAGALRNIISGYKNTAIGKYALVSVLNGNNNIGIGEMACSSITSGSNNICIGSAGSSNTSNGIWIGSASHAVHILGNAQLTSDKRLKNIKSTFNSGLNTIKGLTAYHFTYKDDKTNQDRVGIMAQDLQKVLPSAVSKDEKGYLSIKQEQVTYTMLNAIKELDKMLQDVIVQVQTITKQIANHDKEIKALQKENKELKAQMKTLEQRINNLEKQIK